MLKFAAVGVAGYVFPKHLKAIEAVGGKLVACHDPYDNVGFLDGHNIDCEFFKDFKQFYRYCTFFPPDYFVICSPNYFHYEQCLAGLRLGATVICEKPIVLTVNDIKRLRNVEKEADRRVYTILQSRLKPELIALKERITEGHKVFLRYNTPRGAWYHTTWKSQVRMSGGLATNIGVHLFDLLLWMFGDTVTRIALSEKTNERVVGSFSTPKAEIDFDLSIEKANKVCREIFIDNEHIDFTGNFTTLHTESYEKILAGEGFGLDEAVSSVELCERIRRMQI